MATTYLTPGEVAEKLGVSRQQVLKYLNGGRIKAVRIGGRRLIDRRDVVKPERLKPGPKPRAIPENGRPVK